MESQLHPTLAIDYGTRHWGLAVSDDAGTLALPLRPLIGTNLIRAIKNLEQICKAYRVKQLLVGSPLGLQNKPTQISKRVDNVAAELRQKLQLPVILWNETSSSQLASQSGLSKELQHSEAARILLAEYLSNHH